MDFVLSCRDAFSPNTSAARFRRLQAQLGKGEGVTALLEKAHKAAETSNSAAEVAFGDGEDDMLSQPSSPRLRQTTFGATLTLMEWLCEASSELTQFTPVRSGVLFFQVTPVRSGWWSG